MNEKYEKLVGIATKTIIDRLDKEKHTVGCCVLTKSGKVFTGVNMYMDGMNCVCAEQNAIGTALTEGEKEFEAIVSIGLFDEKCEILAPCGQCRQFLNKYAPDVNVIVKGDKGTEVLKISDLLPYAYKLHHDTCHD